MIIHPPIAPNTVHIWHTLLTSSLQQVDQQRLLLSIDEQARANRFLSSQNGHRFITARATLRQILSFYLNIPAPHIPLAYTAYHKPYLSLNDTPLQFNVSHSHEIAVYAFTLQHAIGIDIERIKEIDYEKIAQRHFSADEYTRLMTLPAIERSIAFYRLWSRKEALLKAVGKGLHIPLHSFSVAVQDVYETIYLDHTAWSLLPLTISPDYQVALASNQPINTVCYWHFNNQTPSLYRTDITQG